MGPPMMLLDFTTYPGPSSHVTTDITILGPLCLWLYSVEFHLKDLQTWVPIQSRRVTTWRLEPPIAYSLANPSDQRPCHPPGDIAMRQCPEHC
ncbi:hypothetical protein L6452_44252 [Arctium lappa]|uniref:Uncharacterized protein n=1 Tax=Arctium lappa TaxID=4217 RepID=A0ACB8XF52_ARCLA|nr:hypothetical protein L6452_44252 [Arctium lappa]